MASVTVAHVGAGLQTEVVGYIDITPSWTYVARGLAEKLRGFDQGEDPWCDEAEQGVIDLGRLMDRTLEFVEEQALTGALKAWLEGYEKGRRLADGR